MANQPMLRLTARGHLPKQHPPRRRAYVAGKWPCWVAPCLECLDDMEFNSVPGSWRCECGCSGFVTMVTGTYTMGGHAGGARISPPIRTDRKRQ